MQKFLLLFQVIVFSILLISCGNTSSSESHLQYIEEKIELPVSSFSEIHGTLIDFYTTSNGNTFFLYHKTQDDVNAYTITKQLSNSMLEEQIPLQIDPDKNYRFIVVDSFENIFLADTTTLYSFNNEAPVDFPIWALGGMIITDDNSVICQTYHDSPY